MTDNVCFLDSNLWLYFLGEVDNCEANYTIDFATISLRPALRSTGSLDPIAKPAACLGQPVSPEVTVFYEKENSHRRHKNHKMSFLICIFGEPKLIISKACRRGTEITQDLSNMFIKQEQTL